MRVRTPVVLAGTIVWALGCSSGQDQASQAEEMAAESADTAPASEVERYQVVVVPEGLTWEEAKQRAEADGGHLVTIGSAEENEQVYALIADNADVWVNVDVTGVSEGEEGPIQVTMGPWIGLYQPSGSSEPDGGWTWVTGEALEYANWATGEIVEPNNLGGVEQYGHFFGAGLDNRASTWNDAANDVTGDLDAAGVELVGEVRNPRGYIVEFDE